MPAGLQAQLIQIAPIVLMVVLFYFMLIRPQQQRAKAHAAAIAAVKRGDNVVLSSGILGKVVRVEDSEVGVEIAQGVTIKVVKSMIAEIRAKGEPAPANDPKS
ncbi:preprotein translocase, YajC subunit [Caulobacter sp. AP07]|jgi:preprotein translocase subunit YajC|uniref:preprotein translocase subunit YajC n=1 Tax=unclassified Caulobacter TaxID=2648921 RepID=UPI00027215FF|nr:MULTISPECIES: preprotein translocase subunit YajC [unclassified Caulobacter]EJL33423.1 preprotein translocase, YajC subunit [Caulobacter sp. AP07]KRA59300.1 preprotein translocase subunit YajC [Caulobacter sp. Root655]